MLHVAYVTAGSVGVGDLIHGLALRRAAERRGSKMRVSLVAPSLPFPAVQALPDFHPVAVDAAPLLDPATALDTPLGGILTALQPDVVVVGHFWAPVQHLVAPLGVEAWLLVRKSPAQWLRGHPKMPFPQGRFARILEMEPVGFDVDGIERWPPLVVANHDECLSRAEARRHFDIDDDHTPLTLIFQAGEAGESAALPVSTPAGGQMVRVDLRDPAAIFPMALALAGAEHVVTGAGYNAYWEARALGSFARTHFVAFPRRLDDQQWRLDTCGDVDVRINGADLLAEALLGG